MDDAHMKKNSLQNSGLTITAEGLRGKQSVRATFRLPDHIIKLLGIVASQLELKQKSLFDQLVEDEEILIKVAEGASGKVFAGEERRQKTYVLSRRSLDVLDNVARQQNIPRDVLVEVSIKRLLPVMNDEQERHRKRKLIYEEIRTFLEQGEKILRKSSRLLGKEDHAYGLLKKIMDVCEENVLELESIIEKGQPIENFELGKGFNQDG
jgi:hypothetical protein